MSAKFSYVWDNESGCWQILSRSGHVVYESLDRSQVRQMCTHIEGLSSGPKLASIREAPPLREAPELEDLEPAKLEDDGEPVAVGGAWLSWPVLLSTLAVIAAAALLLVPDRHGNSRAAAAEGMRAIENYQPQPQAQYQDVWQTEMQERTIRVAKPVYQTVEQEQRTKVLRPVWETEEKEEVSIVKRPVIETSVRYEKFTVNEPVTTYETRTVDQGQWVTQAVQQPTTTATRLRWVPGGYATDAQTGVTSWKLPMFRLVQEPRAGVQQTYRVWQANPVATQVPKLSYAQRIETRPVNVQTVRYVEEKQVRKVPVKVQRMVEQEIVRKVPVTTCRMVYENRVEKVPVKVCRRVAVGSEVPSETGPVLNPPHEANRPQPEVRPLPEVNQPLPGPVDNEPAAEESHAPPSSKHEKISADRVAKN